MSNLHLSRSVCVYDGVLFSLKKERNPAICDHMDKLGGHYFKWNKTLTKRQKATCSHSHMKSTKVKLIETVVTKGWDLKWGKQRLE